MARLTVAEFEEAIRRAMTSVALPGVKGTITRMGLAGQVGADVCAHAPVQGLAAPASTMAAASSWRRVLMLIMGSLEIAG